MRQVIIKVLKTNKSILAFLAIVIFLGNRVCADTGEAFGNMMKHLMIYTLSGIASVAAIIAFSPALYIARKTTNEYDAQKRTKLILKMIFFDLVFGVIIMGLFLILGLAYFHIYG